MTSAPAPGSSRAPGSNRKKIRASGFTLVELLVAAALVGLIAAAGSALTAQVTGARQRQAQSSEHHVQADAALDGITAALRHTFRNPDPRAQPAVLFIGMDDELDGRPADRLRLMRVSDQRVRADGPESDVHEVEFWLEELPDARYAALLRRTDPTRNELPDKGGVVDLVAENIVALDLQYFDGETWAEDWPDFLEAWPLAVRVQLSVAYDPALEPDVPGMARSYRRLVALPWFPEAPSRSETGNGAPAAAAINNEGQQ